MNISYFGIKLSSFIILTFIYDSTTGNKHILLNGTNFLWGFVIYRGNCIADLEACKEGE